MEKPFVVSLRSVLIHVTQKLSQGSVISAHYVIHQSLLLETASMLSRYDVFFISLRRACASNEILERGSSVRGGGGGGVLFVILGRGVPPVNL